MKKVLTMDFSSSITNLCEKNKSFDAGLLKICYPGENRNKSYISKEALENAIPSLFNCPVVCHYNRDTDTLGGHDVEIVDDDSGELKLVNMTQPVGVIPESAKVFFKTFTEDDGTEHEYLCSEVLLWKRQEAYEKIKRDGVTSHSMEISVNSGDMQEDGLYHINNFEFNAFALIGVEPCFEGSSVEMFTHGDLKEMIREMMNDVKKMELENSINPQMGDNDIHPQKINMEGGERVLEEKMSLFSKYNLDADSVNIDLDIESCSYEELEAALVAFSNEGSNEGVENTDMPAGDPILENAEIVNDGEGGEHAGSQFELNSNVVNELQRVLSAETVDYNGMELYRYWYVDCDIEKSEVYAYSTDDYLLYGFAYSQDGDSVSIDFQSAKRKKYVIADFDTGDQNSILQQVFEKLGPCIEDAKEFERKYNDAETELVELRKFKSDKEAEAIDAMFANFESLDGIEEFESLKGSHENMTIEEIEEKCYAIRGKNMMKSENFSVKGTKVPKMSIERCQNDDSEPYGGIFKKFNIGQDA